MTSIFPGTSQTRIHVMLASHGWLIIFFYLVGIDACDVRVFFLVIDMNLHFRSCAVSQMDNVPANCIYSASYLESYPEWAKNKLGKEGYQELMQDQEIAIKINSHDKSEAQGKVKWLGHLPWLAEKLVGIEMVRFASRTAGLSMTCSKSKVCFLFRTIPWKWTRWKPMLASWNTSRFFIAMPGKHWWCPLAKWTNYPSENRRSLLIVKPSLSK